MSSQGLENDEFHIDALELSRRLRTETSRKLADLSHQERCRLLNEHAKNDLILKRFLCDIEAFHLR